MKKYFVSRMETLELVLMLLLHALVLSSSRLVFSLFQAIRLTLRKKYLLRGEGGRGRKVPKLERHKKIHADFSVQNFFLKF
jgi:hypothetical protein